MIKFFRNIRHRLLTESRFSKYLVYALGEIVLVVIGILIALSINNWNQDRIARIKEKLILTDLNSDLTEQSSNIENYVRKEEEFVESGRAVLEYFAQNQHFAGNDSIYEKLNFLITRRTFNPINTTFQELISSGTLGIIRNKELKRKIIRYYHELERITMVTSNNNLHIIDDIFQKEILKYTLFVRDAQDSDLQHINDPIFTDESLKKVRRLAEKALSEEAHLLHLFNLVEQRTFVANAHKEFYKKLNQSTQSLLADVQRQLIN